MKNMLLTALFALTLIGFAGPAQAQATPPNIVFFVADDLGAHDTAVGGSPFYLTPHIDQLAANGMVFTQAYAAHPRCVPSRYALMTGCYPARAGSPGRFYGIERERTTVAEALKAAGYGTYFVGKWHLSGGDAGNPQDHGFDVNIAGGSAGAPGSYEWPYLKKKGKKAKEKPILGLEDGQPGEMLTDRLTHEAEQLIRRHAADASDRPFFLTLSHYGVHTPLQDTPERTATFRKRLRQHPDLSAGPELAQRDGITKLRQDNATYAAMISRLDDSLGRIVALLDQLGMDENTVIVFTSDHGGLSNRGLDNGRTLATSNAPLRAGKGHLFEGGIRVPMIVRWPGVVKAHSTTDALTVGTDHYPTFLDFAGAPLRPDSHADGQSLAPVLRSEAPADRGPVFWHSPRARPASTGDHNASAVRMGPYKLIHWHDEDRDALYDLAQDPSESTDLSHDQPDRVADLRSQLDAWLVTIEAVEPRQRKKK